MRRPPVLLLFNPAAGTKPGASGGDRPDGTSLRSALEQRGLTVRLHQLAPEDDPETLAHGAASEGHDVVAAGGDGTVGRAAAGLIGTEAALGILPFGTFNNIARGVRVPSGGDAALDAIAQGDTAQIDGGLAWPLDPAAPLPARIDADAAPADATWFFEAAGIGLDAAGFGLAAIPAHGIVAGVRALWPVLRRRRSVIPLRIDGRVAGAHSPAITICNGPFHGFGFALAPESDPSDGQLDVVVFRHMGRLEVLAHFLAVARGRPRREPRVQTMQATSVIVGDASEQLPVHADGVPIGTTPVAVTVRPAALKVFR